MNFDRVLLHHLSEERVGLLRGACIGIIGAGGLGSNVAFLLARSGIGSFVIADGDLVEESNLNRQAYDFSDVGGFKVEVLRKNLLSFRADLCVESRVAYIGVGDLALYEPCDIVIEAVDGASVKRELVEALLLSGKRVISASGMSAWGGGEMRVRRFGENLYVVGDGGCEVSESRPAMAPRVMMAAALQADVVLHLLLGDVVE